MTFIMTSVIWIPIVLFCCLAHPLASKPSTTSSLAGIPVPKEVLQGIVPVSRCRATCVNKLLKDGVSTITCQEDGNCSKCWDLCREVQEDAGAALLCSPDHMFTDACNVGCQEACLYFNYEDNEMYSSEQLDFPGHPFLNEVSPKEWVLSWATPMSSADDHPVKMVYVLLYKTDPTHPWIYGGDTVDLFATIDGQLDTYPYLEFKVIAVTQKGITDQANFLFPDDMARETSTSSSTSTTSATPSSTSAAESTSTDSSSVTAASSTVLSITAASESGVEVQVILVNEVLEGILTVMLHSENVTSVRLSWVRVSCRINHFLPVCDLKNQQYEQEIIFQGDKKKTVTLKDLTYNSAYLLRVTPDTQDVAFTSKDVFFMTPTCAHPDVTFLYCLEDPQPETSSMRREGIPEVTSSSTTTVVLIAFSSVAVVIILAGVSYFAWRKFRPTATSESLHYYGSEYPDPVPVITVDGHNYVSLEHVPDLRMAVPHQDQRRRVYTSVPLLAGSGTASPRSLQMTSSIAPPASDSSSIA